MMRWLAGFVMAALAMTTMLLPATAQTAPPPVATLAFGGLVNQPKSFTLDDLKNLPATRETVSFLGEHGQEKATYTGVLLWTLLDKAGGLADGGKRPDLRHTLTVTGRDGYIVVLSLGELDPDFGGKAAIIAYSRESQPFDPARGFRLVVPGDKHGGRDVRDVIGIEVK
jgi:DMSO/TMAO reductase YedYZ molybdopterin-dependent catalytic subunit